MVWPGGVVAAQWGWRAAFWVLAPPGLAVALSFLRFQDYPTVRVDGATGVRSARCVEHELSRSRSGSAGYAGGAVSWWFAGMIAFAYLADRATVRNPRAG